MRTPEQQTHPRGGKKLEADLNMHYLSPGAFTVLPLDVERLPDPPPAPPPYRLPVNSKRYKHAAFAIVGEATPSNPNSRSSSPTGRVSPFRGHGFNPAGSRHASPSSSPVPPGDSQRNSRHRSKIPKPNATGKPRKSSTGALFGEKVSHAGTLNRQGSQSMTNLDGKQTENRPPPSPRKRLKGAQAFKQLSPIQGSSPEPSQSSPGRIPGAKSRSTPPSRFVSPSRQPIHVPSRSRSKPIIMSPDQIAMNSPTKTPRNNKYSHVKAKIDSYNKLPLRSRHESSDLSEDSESPKKKAPSRRNSLNRTGSRANALMNSKNNVNYTSDSSVSDSNRSKVAKATPSVSPSRTKSNTKSDIPRFESMQRKSSYKGSKQSVKDESSSKPARSSEENMSRPTRTSEENVSRPTRTSEESLSKPTRTSEESMSKPSRTSEESISRPTRTSNENVSRPGRTSDEGMPSTPTALDVVSSTTDTVTKPLKIDTPKLPRTKPVSPMIDGRMLSSTSVSQAINKMNDTVLNTQTLIKDSGLTSRFPPATANTSGSVSKNLDSAPVESEVRKPSEPSKLDVSESKPLDVSDVPETTPQSSPQIGARDTKTNKATDNSPAKPAETKTPSPQKNMMQQPKSPTPITNNHNNHVSSVGLGNAKALEKEVQNNMSRLLGSMDSSLGDTPVHKMSINDRIKEARTVVAADVKPIQINVREKPSEVEVQSGNMGPHFGVANGINNERPTVSLPPSQQHSPPEEQPKEEVPQNRCKRFINACVKALTCASCVALSCKCCQCCRKQGQEENLDVNVEENETVGCCQRLTNKCKRPREQVRINIEDEDGEPKQGFWQRLNCCKKNKVGDSQSCFPLGKSRSAKNDQGSFLESQEEERPKCCSKDGCKKGCIALICAIFCCRCCRKSPELPPSASMRKESMVSSKKKSLTPTSVPPPEDTKAKIDASLVEHNSHMKAAIPVLPVWLAWFCCAMNCIGPGTGTVLSGLFCLCIGKPRFSQKDGPKPRIGAFIIDLIIGFSQFFTVLFCLVGWGWSIWWGVIMVKIAKKHKKFKHLEKLEEEAGKPHSLAGQHKRDAERGRK